MNLLSDLSSELAIAILVDKKQTKKVDSKQALELIGKVFQILQPHINEENIRNCVIQPESLKAANH